MALKSKSNSIWFPYILINNVFFFFDVKIAILQMWKGSHLAFWRTQIVIKVKVIKKIKNYVIFFVNNMPLQELENLADELREEIVYTVSKTGGHLSSNLGVVELTISLHYVFDTPDDKIIWDVGHQVMNHKIYSQYLHYDIIFLNKKAILIFIISIYSRIHIKYWQEGDRKWILSDKRVDLQASLRETRVRMMLLVLAIALLAFLLV